MRRFVVIGVGPVGSILSSHLIRSGLDVTLVDILERRLAKIQEKGLSVKDPRNQIIGDFVVFPKKFLFSSRHIKEKPDAIFICVKTYCLRNVISEIREAFSEPVKIVVFQNGLGNQEYVAQVFHKEDVLRCVINYAGRMVSDTEVEVTFFNPPNYLGVMHEGSASLAEELARLITSCGIETRYAEDIKKYEWEKAILNSCLAPVSAVTGLTMKEVMDAPHLKELVETLLLEGIRVGERAGRTFPEDFFQFSLAYLSKGGYHKPSMLVDIENGRETEIDFLNGKIVEYADKLNLSVPYNKMITSIIKGLQQRNRSTKRDV